MTFPLQRYYRYMFLPGLLIFVVPSVIHAYLLMPAPGSQDMESLGTAYFLDRIVPYALVVGGLLIIGPILNTLTNGSRPARFGVTFLMVFLIGITYVANVQLRADKMFLEPQQTVFATAAQNKVPLNYLVVGVEHKGVAKAYPINYIGYHHKVQDSIADMPVLVTYCTMCRAAMVYSPLIDGVFNTFRLVGARHYNAVFEDNATKSWWYQATGEAVEGPLKGEKMEEIPHEQMTLREWIAKYPATLIMQPDPHFTEAYAAMSKYDTLRVIEKNEAGVAQPFSMLSWIVGVEINGATKAYDWSNLLDRRVVNDVVGGSPILVAIDKDSVDYHVWDRTVQGLTYDFTADSLGRGVHDKQTGSLWDWNGECIEGPNTGKQLEVTPSRQMYWHAWKEFHPKTSQWKPK